MLPAKRFNPRSASQGVRLLFRAIGARHNYATKTANSRKRDELPSFKKLALVGVIGTVIFVEAVKSLDKNQPKNSYSESEYAEVAKGLRRRKAIFAPGEINVQLATQGVPTKQLGTRGKVVDPSEIVEYYRQQEGDKYQALLNELLDSHGKHYVEKLPSGMLVMLVGRYLKEVCNGADNVVIANFPLNLKDAIKFENEVCVVDKVLFTESNAGNDLAKYFQTVDKVEIV